MITDTNKIGWVLTLTVTTRLDFTSLGRGLKEGLSPTLPYSRPQLTAAICTHCRSEESGTDREKDRECRYVGKRSQIKQRGIKCVKAYRETRATQFCVMLQRSYWLVWICVRPRGRGECLLTLQAAREVWLIANTWGLGSTRINFAEEEVLSIYFPLNCLLFLIHIFQLPLLG